MNPRARKLLPLAAGLLLGAALLRSLLSSPEAPPPAAAPVASPPSAASPPPEAPAAPVSPSVRPEAPASASPVTSAEAPRGTVVPVGPGDEVPLPEVENAPPQQNDPVEPEQPQTAAWRHEKLVRLTEVLGRDLERLDQERQAAQARGDGAEARRLEVQLSRQRARLGSLRQESAELAEAARREAQAP